MLSGKSDLNIAKSIKMVEWLKNQLLSSVAELFQATYRGRRDAVVNTIADIFVVCYLLARRLSINFIELETVLEQKVRASIDEDHEIEKWYGDLSNLLQHIESRRKR